jgi:uncharacterized protein (TIGR03067 family)
MTRPEPEGGDLQSLQGTWRAIHAEADGSSLPAHLYRDARLVISGCRFSLTNPLPDAEQNVCGSFAIDPSARPRRLDVTPDGGATLREVYELEDDTLTVCYQPAGAAPPTGLGTVPGSGLVLFAYRREGKAAT